MARELELAVDMNDLCELDVAAERVCHSHLLGSAAFGFEELRIADEGADAPRSGGCDVEPVAADDELHAVRRSDSHAYLALKFINRSDARAVDALGDLGDLRVVRRDN